MARDVIIVARATGSARVSVLSQGGKVGYKSTQFEPSHDGGYLNALDLVSYTLEQSVENKIEGVTVFTLSNVANAVKRYYSCKKAISTLKLETEESMAKTFDLFVEGKSTEMGEKEQEAWKRFTEAEFYASEAGLLKEIRSIYTGAYVQKMQDDLDKVVEEAGKTGVIKFNARDSFKKRIIKAHKDAWDLVPGGEEEEVEITDAF